MSTLFISDLHLSRERPGITRLFLDFLQGRAREARALYILGDLFEAWLGDDLVLPEYQPVIEGLRILSRKGVPVYVMHGNRDFLLAETFEAMSGAKIIDDPSVIELDGRRVLLMHGDTLCTGDLPYQRLREQLRNPAWIADFLQKPAQERIDFARQLREKSREETAGKAEEIMDVDAGAVEQAMRQHGVELLIHGHTHRPASHEFELDGRPVRRLVLGDWYESGSVLLYDAGEFRLTRLPLAP